MQWLNKYLSTTIEIKKYGVGNHGLETNNVQPFIFKNLRNSFIFTNICQSECFLWVIECRPRERIRLFSLTHFKR